MGFNQKERQNDGMIKKRDVDTEGPGKQKRYTKILMRKIGTLFKFPFARGTTLWKLGVKI
jgi:hypothetical protein